MSLHRYPEGGLAANDPATAKALPSRPPNDWMGVLGKLQVGVMWFGVVNMRTAYETSGVGRDGLGVARHAQKHTLHTDV